MNLEMKIDRYRVLYFNQVQDLWASYTDIHVSSFVCGLKLRKNCSDISRDVGYRILVFGSKPRWIRQQIRIK